MTTHPASGSVWAARHGLAATLLILALGATPARAATNFIQMVSTSFVPRLFTNRVGDSVIWTNTSTTFSHNVVSSNGAWSATPAAPSPYRFTNHFTAAGVYGYNCSVHPAMAGIIYVQAPPTVTLTNPATGITLAAPATITLGAAASDPDGSVTNVQFYSGSTLLGATNTIPYRLGVSNLAANSYTFTARAFDNSGLSATSAPVSVAVVTPDVIRFAGVKAPLAAGQLPLALSVTPGLRYQIDWTSTFTNWFALTNFIATNATMNFTAPATGSWRAFKAWLLPNP